MAFILPLLLTLPAASIAAIMVSLGFAVMFTALFFMAAYSLNNPQLIAVSKEELSALLFSVIIIIFWLSMDAFVNTVVGGLLGGSAGLAGEGAATSLAVNHVDLAYGALEVLFVKLKDTYINLYLFEVIIGFLSTVSFPMGSPIPAVNVISLSVAPFTGLVLLSNAHTTVVEAIGYAMTLIWAKQFVLLFCRDIIPLLLLPFGLVMRAFPFFRSSGSSIIALCVAGYFVLPFAILLSNYMIFELYEPAEFVYSPETTSLMSGRDIDSHEQVEEGMIREGREGSHTNELAELFTGRQPAEQVSTEGGACDGESVFWRFFCGAGRVLTTGYNVVRSFVSTVWNMSMFMVGMTGDFIMTAFNNPLMPPSVSAGLYYFIITEVTTVGQFLILVIVTSVVEVIITVTMYRNIAMLLGGDVDLAGLTKIV